MSVRAKFVVTNKSAPREATRYLGEGQTEQVQVVDVSLIAVSKTLDNPENAAFYANTPSGQLTMNTVNLNAAAAFIVGHEYYLDFTDATPEEATS